MRIIKRIAVGLAVAFAVSLAIGVAWFYFSGMQNLRELRAYAPATEGMAAPGTCIGPVDVAPESEVRGQLPVLFAAEGDLQHGHYDGLIARDALCASHDETITRELKEFQLTQQIRWHFTRDERLTIFLNRVWFGDGQYGLVQGARHYFGVRPSQMSVTQAALLMGMISRPNYFSPFRHPDRALARRNAVLETMRVAGSLTVAEAMEAEAAPLPAQ